ncbi:OLC1v1012780C1 [Oldenlandia corymbosa var. corymbosa]|uniref:OLC1v1012780C1 n=1 Tax=Oldenlandia corymbosa var. corymbosa TaxID=529605 RepID=A0AAV1DWM9_OLDCO|nr:OLC1v1012780C1 [Oldenlandia corymbosa var. corymbosa]
MADAVIGATIQVLLEKAISLATDRISLVFGFEKELEVLRESARMVQAVLADADDKQTESEMCIFGVLSSKISEVNENLESCNLKATEIELIRTCLHPEPASTSSVAPCSNSTEKLKRSRESNSIAPEFVVGRSEEKTDIVATLLRSSRLILGSLRGDVG